MKTLLLLLAFAARPVPPTVVIPPRGPGITLGWRAWWSYIPPVEQLAPGPTWEELHALDMEVCEAGPAQVAEFPNVQRCQGLI